MNIDPRISIPLQSMGYRWRLLHSDVGHFLKPVGHGCLIFRGGRLEMVFESVELSVMVWSSSPIDILSPVPVLRQIMIAEAMAIDGAKFDRNGVTFAFLSRAEVLDAAL